jgi:hypothetical protein
MPLFTTILDFFHLNKKPNNEKLVQTNNSVHTPGPAYHIAKGNRNGVKAPKVVKRKEGSEPRWGGSLHDVK